MISQKFYMLSQTYTGYAKAIREEKQFDTVTCQYCGAVFQKRKKGKFRLHFEGKKEGDYYYAPICHIVSDRLLKLLYENAITGFSEREIECIGWIDGKGKPLQKDSGKYKELVVTGHTGDVTLLSGEKAIKCEKCGAIKTRLLYNKKGLSLGDNWDGTDIFYFKNWEVLIVSERVKELLEVNKMKNITFESIEEYKFGGLL